MAIEITVQLFPAPGGGVQMVNTPQGPLPVPIPFLNYERVREVKYDSSRGVLKFTIRDGSEIETNIPYLIKRTQISEGEA